VTQTEVRMKKEMRKVSEMESAIKSCVIKQT
jgi:hypothetical protein